MDIEALWQRIAWLGKELRAKGIDPAKVGIETSVALRMLAATCPQHLHDFKRRLAQILGVADLDRWIEITINECRERDAAQYLIAQAYSTACVIGDDYSVALRIWSLALTSTRPQQEQLEAINAAAAPEYDAALPHQQSCRNFMNFLRPSLEGKNDFIDLCCGTGLTTEHLHLPDKRVLGIDLELEGLRTSGRTSLFSELQQGDAQAILPSLPAANFDAIWCCGAVYFFSDLNWIFSESSRLLQPGGLLCLTAWPSPESMDISITKGGSFRYCHSYGYLNRCAAGAGMHLARTRQWSITYGMPTWFLLFKKGAPPT